MLTLEHNIFVVVSTVCVCVHIILAAATVVAVCVVIMIISSVNTFPFQGRRC